MQNTDIIIKPLVTEKSTRMQSSRNEYAFQVHCAASKDMIKHAVEQLYSVKVEDVRTMNRKGKPRRTKKGETHAANWKRAIVRLEENSKIDLF